jgi:CheY-like chemotaxis protein
VLKIKILIVEDEGLTAVNLKSNLLELGYEVVAIADSGEEAIQKALSLLPDIILMDITLKGTINGIQAAMEIRKSKAIPIIYLTAHTDSETIAQAKLTKPYGYLPKPCSKVTVATTIEMALYKSNAEQERERLLTELEEAMTRVKLLSGLLPVCASCKNIRNEMGHWQKIEAYISEHSEAEFSHGVCPECTHKLYPEVAARKNK